MVLMLLGENTREVADRVKAWIEVIKGEPAAGRDDRPLLRPHRPDRAGPSTVAKNLVEGGGLVVAVLLLLLGNVRAGLMVAAAIPLSMLLAFDGMVQAGISGNLMSLGAIDFGLIVDGAVVMIENVVRRARRSAEAPGDRSDVVREAAREVARPTMFGELIIMIVYLPILTLRGHRGQDVPADGADGDLRAVRLDGAVAHADAGARSLAVRRRVERRERSLVRWLKARYRPRCDLRGAHAASRWRALLRARGRGSLARSWAPSSCRSSRGRDVVQHRAALGVSVGASLWHELDRARTVEEFPDEIDHVWTRIGTAEVATDPMGVEVSDVFITLKPARSGSVRRRRTSWSQRRRSTERAASATGCGYSAADRDARQRDGRGVRAT